MTQIHDSQSIALTPADGTLMAKDASSTTTHTCSTPPDGGIKFDIEHALVEDDPRTWSHTRKVRFLFRPYE